MTRTDLLERSAVGHPLRDLFHDQPNVRVHLDKTTGLDLEKREAQFVTLRDLRAEVGNENLCDKANEDAVDRRRQLTRQGGGAGGSRAMEGEASGRGRSPRGRRCARRFNARSVVDVDAHSSQSAKRPGVDATVAGHA